MPAGEVEVDQIDRGNPRAAEGDVVVEHPALLASGEVTPVTRSARSGPEPGPESAVRVLVARDREIPVADEVEDDSGLRRAEGAGRDLASPQSVPLELGVLPGRRLLSVEEDDDQGGAELPRPDGARQLPDNRSARGRVVRADEAGQFLRVVVGGQNDAPTRVSPGNRPDDVPQTARHGLEAASRNRAAEELGELTRLLRACGARTERDLALQERPGPPLVEPVYASGFPRRGEHPAATPRDEWWLVGPAGEPVSSGVAAATPGSQANNREDDEADEFRCLHGVGEAQSAARLEDADHWRCRQEPRR